MTIPDHFIHSAVTIDEDATAMDAARRMKAFNVGSLVVTDAERLVGMVTDRDLALHILEEGLDPEQTQVSACMTEDVITLATDDGLDTAIELMRFHGIRRLPVLDEENELVGVVAADDLVQCLADELRDVAGTIRAGLSMGDRQARKEGSPVFGRE